MKNTTGLFPADRLPDTTVSWITPKQIIDRLGPFDLDPCACVPQPWACATHQYQLPTNGLSEPWFGRVWLNPPYGRNMLPWIQKMATHNTGIALIFARTDTKWFHVIWQTASCLFFISHRILFHTPDGKLSNGRLAASVLVGWGEDEKEKLKNCGFEGVYVENHQWRNGKRIN